MVGDNKFSHGSTLQGPNPKAGLPLSFIKYDLNHVSDLETENISNEFPSSNPVKKLLKEAFSAQMRRDIILSQRGKRDRSKIIGHKILLEGELNNKVGMLLHFWLGYYMKIKMCC